MIEKILMHQFVFYFNLLNQLIFIKICRRNSNGTSPWQRGPVSRRKRFHSFTIGSSKKPEYISLFRDSLSPGDREQNVLNNNLLLKNNLNNNNNSCLMVPV